MRKLPADKKQIDKTVKTITTITIDDFMDLKEDNDVDQQLNATSTDLINALISDAERRGIMNKRLQYIILYRDARLRKQKLDTQPKKKFKRPVRRFGRKYKKVEAQPVELTNRQKMEQNAMLIEYAEEVAQAQEAIPELKCDICMVSIDDHLYQYF